MPCGVAADCIRFEGLSEGKCIDDKCEDGRWGAMCNNGGDCIQPEGLSGGGVCRECKQTVPARLYINDDGGFYCNDEYPLTNKDGWTIEGTQRDCTFANPHSVATNAVCYPPTTKHDGKYLAGYCDPMVETDKYFDDDFMQKVLSHANCNGITYEPSNSRYTGRVGTQLLDSPNKEFSLTFDDRDGWTPVRSAPGRHFWVGYSKKFCNSGVNGAACGSIYGADCVSGVCNTDNGGGCVGNGPSASPPPHPPPPFPPPLGAEAATLDCTSATSTMPMCSVSAWASLPLVPIANRIETDVTGVGLYSGKCTCPNGEWYWAGAEYLDGWLAEDACARLACYKFDRAEADVTSTGQLSLMAEGEGADNALCLPPSDYTDGPGADHAEEDKSYAQADPVPLAGATSGAGRRITCAKRDEAALNQCNAPGATTPILSTSWCPPGWNRVAASERRPRR